MRQGTVKATGVAVKVPLRELNLSSESPRRMHDIILRAIMAVLSKLISHLRKGPFFSPLNMYDSRITLAGYAYRAIEITMLTE